MKACKRRQTTLLLQHENPAWRLSASPMPPSGSRWDTHHAMGTRATLQLPMESHRVYLGVGWQVGTLGASSDSAGANDQTGDETEVTVCVLMRRRDVRCPHTRQMTLQELGPKYVAGLTALYEGKVGCFTMSEPLSRLCDSIGVKKVAHTIMFAGEPAAKPVRGGNRRRADAAAATAVEGSDEEEEEEDAEEEDGPAEAGSSDADGEGHARKRQRSDKSDSDSDGEGECRVPQHPVATHLLLQSPTGAHDRKTTPQDPVDSHRPPRGPTVTHNLT